MGHIESQNNPRLAQCRFYDMMELQNHWEVPKASISFSNRDTFARKGSCENAVEPT
jgi:hypothetical protein